jgi:predicted nucleic acid-binding protein
VVLEVRKGRRSSPARTWLERYPETVARFATPAESSLYLALLQQEDPATHEGEAAAIAIAAERGGVVVMRDRAAEAKAAEHGVQCMTTEEFLAKWPHRRR